MKNVLQTSHNYFTCHCEHTCRRDTHHRRRIFDRLFFFNGHRQISWRTKFGEPLWIASRLFGERGSMVKIEMIINPHYTYRELKEWKMTYLNKFYKFQRNCRKWNSWGEEWDRTSFVLFVRQQINRKRIEKFTCGNSFDRNSVVSALPDLHLECGYLRNRFILRKKIEWLLSLHKSCQRRNAVPTQRWNFYRYQIW